MNDPTSALPLTTTAVADTTPPPVTLATPRQKGWTAVLLVLFTLLVGAGWFSVFVQLGDLDVAETVVHWDGPSTGTLKAGPAFFIYDSKAKSLRCKGVIDSKMKADLVALFVAPEIGEAGSEKNHAAELSAYSDAVGQLAYQSNASLNKVFAVLLCIGGLSGVLGVQLRSMVNFVNICCYKRELDISTWWPWYCIRPFTGAVLGTIVVILLKAGFFNAGDKSSAGSVWWVSIAFLAGFGATEFTDKLRLLSRTLFGEASSTVRSTTESATRKSESND